MGYMRHHAIVVTSWDSDLIEKAHKAASDSFPWVSPVSEAGVNDYQSFFIPPDGSKEGWDSSDLGDSRRAGYVRWLDSQRYEDGSTALDWVEVQFGDDNYQTAIVNDSDAFMRSDDQSSLSASDSVEGL